MSFSLEYPVRRMTMLCRRLSIALFLSLIATLVTAAPTMDPETEALERHSQWMVELGFSGTPGLLFKNTSGQWRGQTGVPTQEALGIVD